MSEGWEILEVPRGAIQEKVKKITEDLGVSYVTIQTNLRDELLPK